MLAAPPSTWLMEYGKPLSVTLPEEALLAIPDHLFNAALEHGRLVVLGRAVEPGRLDEAGNVTRERINRLYSENGVPCQFDERDHLVPRGSVTLSVSPSRLAASPSGMTLLNAVLRLAQSGSLRRALRTPALRVGPTQTRDAKRYICLHGLGRLPSSGHRGPTKRDGTGSHPGEARCSSPGRRGWRG